MRKALWLAFALAGCMPVDVVVRGVPRDRRVTRPENVALYTPETGEPERPFRRNGVFEVRTLLPWRREGRVLPKDNGFAPMRRLRGFAHDQGCDAVFVAEPRLEYDEVLCGRRETEPVPCFAVHRATCLVFD